MHFWIPSRCATGRRYLRRIACPQYGLRPRWRLLAPNRLAWCRHIVFASLIKHQQGADERARAFAMTQSCMARLRRRLWIALRSSCLERDRCRPISNQTTRSAANRSIPQGEPRSVLECLNCPTLPRFHRASRRLALCGPLHSDERGRLDCGRTVRIGRHG
jgi:hypothetical protein